MRRWARHVRSPTVHLVVVSWLLFGCLVNVPDQRAFDLMHMGADALVEHGTFELGLSDNPQLIPRGDTFVRDGRTLSNKQPAGFVLGAASYWVWRLLGVTYDDYDLAAALVTWTTASLAAALAVGLVFGISHRLWGHSIAASASAALVFGFATTMLPYSGVMYHDTIATALVLAVFAALEKAKIASLQGGERGTRWAFLGGLAAALALATSLLPLVVVLVLGAYGMTMHRARFAGTLLAGLALGLLPLVVFNARTFGAPFTAAYLALGDARILPDLSPAHVLWQLRQYLGFGAVSVTCYAPAVVLGWLATPLLRRQLRVEKIVLAIVAAVHVAYVATMPTLGVCQYPPRFLLPILGFACLPLAALVDWHGRPTLTASVRIGGAAVVAVSLFSNVMGALFGAMNCDLRAWLPAVMVTSVPALSIAAFPLAPFCLALLAVEALVLMAAHRGRPVGSAS